MKNHSFPMSYENWLASLPGHAFRDPNAVVNEPEPVWKKGKPKSVEELPISTSRDNYGWRSLKTGTRYLGGPER